jgi:hypothetical protein
MKEATAMKSREREIFLLACLAMFMFSCGGGNGEEDADEDVAADVEVEDGDAPADAPVDETADSPADPTVDDGTDAPPVEHPNESSPLGTNLTGISDWSTEWPFVDVFKTSRAWISGNDTDWDDGRAIDTDDSGWVRSLAEGPLVRTLMFWDLGDLYPGGQYTVLYEGEGTIEYWNAAAKNEALSAPGRDVIDVDPSAGGIGMNITEVNPDDYLRNIRVIMPGGVCTDNGLRLCEGDGDCDAGTCSLFVDSYASQIFFPPFLDRIKTYKVLRFMDWMATNDSPVETWADRARVDHARWSLGAGVPVEIMVELANRMAADPWFTLPHLADDDFVSNFAGLVAASLDPGLKAYVEFSNEVWNGIFAQSGWARDQGLAAGLSGDDYQAQLFFYSRRAVQVHGLFEEAFGSADRLVRVMATQAANAWVSEQVLSFEDAYLGCDALAVAPYFGGYLGGPDEQARVQAMSADDLLAELGDAALPTVRGWLESQAAAAEEHGVDLIAYEGGQHLAGNGGVENNDVINALFDEANRDERMGELYLDYLDLWREEGGRLFAHFVNCSRYSKWGRWGALEYQTQPRAEAPKYDALQTFIETTPVWW